MQNSMLCSQSISISDWVSIGVAALAVIVSIWSYFHGLNRERRIDTLKAFSEIKAKNYFTNEMSEDDKLEYMNTLEYFATGVNSRIYSFDIVYKMSANRLIYQYDTWSKEFIEKFRAIKGNSEAYCEYEKVINKLKKEKRLKKRAKK